jgi:hypothetical protein
MAKVTLRASGGLNKDLDANNLPEGDYSDASNIVFDSGKTGGAGAMRMTESLIAAGISFTDEIKTTFKNYDNKIYVLTKNATTASIFELPAPDTSTTKTLVLTYTHGVTTDFTPDLKIVGTLMVWNYCGDGTLLSYSLTRAYGSTLSVDNIKLQKRTPNNIVSIAKVVTSGQGKSTLESTDVQFASRYVYDTGEYSVLSNYSQMFKAEKNTKEYSIIYNFTTTPSYTTAIELYVRFGNNGTWRRADTVSTASGITKTWTGEVYESLDSITVGKPFDAVPVYAKHIEVAKNTIFLANIKDDYSVDAVNLDFSFNSTVGNGYALGSGTYTSYLGANKDATSSETTSDGTGYVKPFANNSTYAIGLAYYDEALKTRGVEKFTKFTTGKFALPLIPDVTITLASTYVKPSWAKYAQFVYTKNINKSYVFEGFASNIFFEINFVDIDPVTKEKTDIVTYSQNVTTDQLKDVKHFVVDLMGMFRAGYNYTFQQYDRITIKTPLSADNGFLDLEIVGQDSNLIYCRYAGTAMTLPEIPVPDNLYFEIYTPKQAVQDEALLFYEYGSLIDISSWAGSSTKTIIGTGTLNSNKLIGDTVFSKIEMPIYSTAPFLYNSQKTIPSTVVEDVITTFTGLTSATLQSSLTNAGRASDKKVSPVLTIGANGDGASLITGGDAFKVSGFYEVGNQDPSVNKMTIAFDLTASYQLTLLTPSYPTVIGSGDMLWTLYAQMYRTPYNNKDNKYEPTETFGKRFSVDTKNPSTATSSSSYSIATNYEINLSTDIKKDINANDKFSLELTLEFSTSGDISYALVNIAKNSSASAGVTITLNGDRTTTRSITTYNSNATVASTNSKFLVRSMSNAIGLQQWNTSSGKPTLEAKDTMGVVRKNTIRHSGNYVEGTKINNINSFFALDSKDVPIENGQINSLQRASRLQGNGAMLLALCDTETSYVFLGEQELTQGNNTSIRSITSNMIGTIRNLGAGLGLQNKLSVMNYNGTIWWWDDFNKKVVKYTDKGIEIPSDVFMKSYFLGQGGTNNPAKFAYDSYYNMCYVGFTSNSVSYGWSDNLNRWISEYSFRTGFAESYGDAMILFKDNVVYKSTSGAYNSLLGTTYNSSIAFTINSQTPIRPLNMCINHNMNVIDYTQSNYVKSSLLTIGITNENGQSTSIVESNWLMEDNKLYSHILRDTNSSKGIIEGDYIVGYLNKITLTMKDASQAMKINSIDLEIEPVNGHR